MFLVSFILMVEEFGLIFEFGEFVFYDVIEVFVCWLENYCVSVNVLVF